MANHAEIVDLYRISDWVSAEEALACDTDGQYNVLTHWLCNEIVNTFLDGAHGLDKLLHMTISDVQITGSHAALAKCSVDYPDIIVSGYDCDGQVYNERSNMYMNFWDCIQDRGLHFQDFYITLDPFEPKEVESFWAKADTKGILR